VPPLVTMRSSTLALLRKFAEAGGTVIWCGELPSHIDAAKPQPNAFAFASRCKRVAYERSAVATAAGNAARDVSITRPDGSEHTDVLYHLRCDGDDCILFLCNTNRKAATGPLTIKVRARGRVQLWDAEHGTQYAVASKTEGGMVSFATDMAASGSALFVVTPRAESLPPWRTLKEVRNEPLPADGWRTVLTEPNVLVLDFVEFRARDGAWQGPLEVLKADAALRGIIGVAPRGGHMVQPWARPKKKNPPSADVELRARFIVEAVPSGSLALALEEPSRWEVRLNGRRIPAEAECGWWVDRSLRLLPLSASDLVVGQNEVMLSGRYDETAGIEAMFLLGNFGVRLEGARATVTEPQAVAFGDWVEQGLPFYGGSVVFRRRASVTCGDGERVFIVVPDFRGACVRVLVDGQEAAVLAWPPYEAEVTELVRSKAEVELAVEVISHRRNAFGPLHLTQKWPRWTGPGQYVTSGNDWQDAYNLVPCGCMTPPRLSYRKEEV
jgi:hypothetical protein